MAEPITFRVYGLPAPGGSKKGFYNAKAKRVSIVDDCKRSKPWMARVASEAVDYFPEPLTGPIRLTLVFILPRPKGHFGTGKNASVLKLSAPSYPVTKPDTTKLVRSTEDALKGIAWVDDSQVVIQSAWKEYGTRPGVTVMIDQLKAKERPCTR